MVLGERIFRSWVLLFGVLPIDFDDLTLIALEHGRGFHERSRMLSMRVWEHERALEPVARVAAGFSIASPSSRGYPASDRCLSASSVLTFRNRHRRLRRQFG